MASNSTKRRGKNKRKADDIPDGFPLTIRRDGRLCKKSGGRVFYFGRMPDWQSALVRFNREWPFIVAGLPVPAAGTTDGATLADVVNTFLTSKERRCETGEIKPSTFSEYFRICKKLVQTFGKQRPIASLTPANFSTLRARLAKRQAGGLRSPVSLAKDVRTIRMVFRFAFESGILDKPLRLGPEFVEPAQRSIRKARRSKGPRMFSADELREIIDAAGQPMRAMVLLGINAAYGNTDVATLPRRVVDLKSGWVTFPRPKNDQERRVKLWPETLDAIGEAIESRPTPKDSRHTGLMFITRIGQPWTRNSTSGRNGWIDSVGSEFSKLLVALGLKRPGISFYAIRHTFRTVADETRDFPAIDRIMGHSPDKNDMAARYRERIDDERLEAVTDHVRRWLWPEPACENG